MRGLIAAAALAHSILRLVSNGRVAHRAATPSVDSQLGQPAHKCSTHIVHACVARAALCWNQPLCAIRPFAHHVAVAHTLWGPRAGVFDGLGGSVPIGLVSNNWGGTRVEQWIPVETSLPCGHASTGELYAQRCTRTQ